MKLYLIKHPDKRDLDERGRYFMVNGRVFRTTPWLERAEAGRHPLAVIAEKLTEVRGGYQSGLSQRTLAKRYRVSMFIMIRLCQALTGKRGRGGRQPSHPDQRCRRM